MPPHMVGPPSGNPGEGASEAHICTQNRLQAIHPTPNPPASRAHASTILPDPMPPAKKRRIAPDAPTSPARPASGTPIAPLAAPPSAALRRPTLPPVHLTGAASPIAQPPPAPPPPTEPPATPPLATPVRADNAPAAISTSSPHAPQVNAETTWYDQVGQDTVFDPELFARASLVINTTHSLLICLICHAAVPPSQVMRHHNGNSHPPVRGPTSLLEDVRAGFRRVGLEYNSPKDVGPSPEPPRPIFGLPRPEQRLQCHACFKTYADPHSLRSHACRSHRPQTPHVGSPVWTQAATPSHWIVVCDPDRHATPPTSHSLRQQAFADTIARRPPPALTVSIAEDDRMLNTFLARERWVDILDGLDAAAVADWAKVEDNHPEMPGLARHLLAYMAEAQWSYRSLYTSKLVSMRPSRLKPLEMVEFVHRDVGLHAHAKYSRDVAPVIATVIKQVTLPPQKRLIELAIPGDVAEACRELCSELRRYAAAPAAAHDPAEGAPEDPFDHLGQEDELDAGAGEELEPDVAQEPGLPLPPGSAHAGATNARKPPPTDPHVQVALHRLLYLLFTQPAPKEVPTERKLDHRKHLLVLGLIFRSVKDSGTWSQPSRITQTIAALTHIGRLVFMRAMHESPVGDGLDPDEFDVARLKFDAVARKYLEEWAGAPMPTLYGHLRALSAMKSAYEHRFAFNSSDHSGEDVVFPNNAVLTVDHMGGIIRQLLHRIQARFEDVYRSLGIFGNPDFEIPPTCRIVDDPANSTAGYGFTSDTANAWHTGPTILNHILAHEAIFKRFAILDQNGKLRWLPFACHQVMAAIHAIHLDLASAILLTSGEPPRGTELSTHSYRNVPGGAMRNAFWLCGVFTLMGTYNKNSHLTGTEQCMVRVPAIPIGELFTKLLVHLRPLYSEWQYAFRPGMYENSLYQLFAGLNEPVVTEHLSKALCDYIQQHAPLSMGVRLHRQYMSFVTSQHQLIFAELANDASATNHQIGHTARTDDTNYHPDRRFPKGLPMRQFYSDLRTSGAFHALFLGDYTLLEQAIKPSPRQADILARIRRLQGIGAATDAPIPAGPGPAASGPPMITIAPSDLLVLQEAIKSMAESAATKAVATAMHIIDPKATYTSQDGTPYTDPNPSTHPFFLRTLRQYMQDPAAAFKTTSQARVVALMYGRKDHVLYVAPTGSGKTLPGLLNAKLLDDGQTTVILLPLRVMHEQYHLLCSRITLPCESWKLQSRPEAPLPIVLATIDYAALVTFQNYLRRLHSTGRLARIIIDEAHLMVDHADFRRVMAALAWFGAAGVQIVLLTATAPPSLESHILKAVGVKTCITVRESTVRPNISYRVVRCSDPRQSLIDTVNTVLDSSPDARILVFCRTAIEASKLSQALTTPDRSVPACYAKAEGIEEMAAKFRLGDTPCIVGTTVLSVGFDARVTHVFELDTSFSTLDYNQRAGRAGRDASSPPVYMVSFIRSGVPPGPAYTKDGAAADPVGKEYIKTVVGDTGICRRFLLQQFVDGKGITCAEVAPKTHMCDVCETASRHAPPRTHSKLARAQQTQAGISDPLAPPMDVPLSHQLSAKLSQLAFPPVRPLPPSDSMGWEIANVLETLSHSCAACWIVHTGLVSDHLPQDCPILSKEERLQKYAIWRSGLHRATAFCHTCYCPQHLKYVDSRGVSTAIHPYTSTHRACMVKDALTLSVWLIIRLSEVPEACEKLLPPADRFSDWMLTLPKDGDPSKYRPYQLLHAYLKSFSNTTDPADP
ncbi:hypothetical protein BV25DRAFT_1916911 [Artomyces pyxidatus]|uniref:Uncharacterized protein n=1 Tax=Artomyces pyxidatus TaxID=48021 RepID=A0ACB8SYK8_9AGAM|nr:hypothetical protein BV25DRAFT_1916911 [Artomyces pyxidatus]